MYIYYTVSDNGILFVCIAVRWVTVIINKNSRRRVHTKALFPKDGGNCVISVDLGWTHLVCACVKKKAVAAAAAAAVMCRSTKRTFQKNTSLGYMRVHYYVIPAYDALNGYHAVIPSASDQAIFTVLCRGKRRNTVWWSLWKRWFFFFCRIFWFAFQ